MLRRKKRIPYDPPSARKKNTKRKPWRRVDQVFLSRRMLVLKGAIVAAFGALSARLGYMQIAHGADYAQEATDKVVHWRKEKAPRGLIFDRVGRSLAENRRAWEVRIVPADLPAQKSTDWQVIRDYLITALRLPEALVVNPAGVPLGMEDTVYGRVARLLDATTPEDIQGWIDTIKQKATFNYLVLVDHELTPNQVGTFRAAANELPGVEVINYFDYLVRNIGDPRQPITLKRDVSRDIALKLAANRLYLPGVELDDSVLVRKYPGSEVMSHILGYVQTISKEEFESDNNRTPAGNPIYDRDDIIGTAGLEAKMEEMLRGQKGGRYVEVNAHGLEVGDIPGTENPPVPGKNLKLTIDLELQAAINDALAKGIRFSNEDRAAKQAGKEFKSGSGAVVVLDPRNGEVLALVSYPNYDNQLFIDGISVRKFQEYKNDPNKPLFNRAYADHFPPGSTLKLFTAISALREKLIDEGTKFTCKSAIKVPWTWDETKGTSYPCWSRSHGFSHNELTVVDAIEQSCDIFFYNVGTPRQPIEGTSDYLHYRDLELSGALGALHYFQGLGIQRIKKNLTERFWFSARTGIDLPGEARGLVPDPQWKQDIKNDGWSSGDTINVSIGQGDFLASPLQVALNVATLANGGTIYKPQLVQAVVADDGKPVQRFDPKVLRKLKLNSKHLNIVHEGMRRVVNEDQGTANHTIDADGTPVTKWPLTNPAGEPQIIVGGKTGTAEFGKQNDDLTYDSQHAWFTCFAPFDAPEVAVVVFIYDGGEGASYAVPVADKVLRAYFELTGKRPRGLVLREDGKPISEQNPAPSGHPGAQTGTPVPNATPQAAN